MQVTVDHSLPRAEARQRLEQFAEKLKQQFPGDAKHIQQTWDGDTCTVNGKVKGFAFACELQLTESEVTAEGNLPFFARPFQSTIEAAIRKGLKQALGET